MACFLLFACGHVTENHLPLHDTRLVSEGGIRLATRMAEMAEAKHVHFNPDCAMY
jgi:hypothetical protein